MQNGTSKPERDAHGWGRKRCQPPGSGGNGSSLERVVAELNFQGGVTQSRTQRLQRPRGVTEGVWLARLGRSLERDAAGCEHGAWLEGQGEEPPLGARRACLWFPQPNAHSGAPLSIVFLFSHDVSRIHAQSSCLLVWH